MAGASLDAAFGVETLTTMVRTFDTMAFDKGFSDLFRKSSIVPDGDSVSWDEVRFDRDLAPVTGFDSPAPHVAPLERRKKQAFMANVKLYTDIPGHKLFKERGPGSLSANAEQIIANEVFNLRQKCQKTINYMAAKLLTGSLTISDANIKGSEITTPAISPGVSTWSKLASWATGTTKILSSELPDLTKNYISNSGRLPGFALINQKTEGYLVSNAEVQTWATHQFGGIGVLFQPAAEKVANGVPIGGFTWNKIVHGYVPAGGSFTQYMPDDTAIVLPPMDQLSDVLAMAEGRGIIPQQAYGAESANGLISEAPSAGFYSYATAQENPVGVRIYVGWLGLPIIKYPLAVQVATLVQAGRRFELQHGPLGWQRSGGPILLGDSEWASRAAWLLSAHRT